MPQFPEGLDPRDMSAQDALEITKTAFTHLIQNVPGGDLRDLFQIVVGEMYIRSDNDDIWEEQWSIASESVLEMFNPETCPMPEILQDYIDAREELNVQKAARFDNAFSGEAKGELAKLFELHGVVETDDVDDEDEAPGQYL